MKYDVGDSVDGFVILVCGVVMLFGECGEGCVGEGFVCVVEYYGFD